MRSTRPAKRGITRCGRRDHAGAVALAVCAVDHNPLTDRHAGIDRCHWAIGRADIDRSDRHPVVGVDDVDVTSRCAGLDGGGRHRDDIMQRLYQKLRVDELIGNSALSALSNCARTFTVPVVVSIWLSSLPPGRLQAF
jgi:hypothetical protein